MPRIAGQVDPRKSEAILKAASDLFAERGAAVTMEEIARRAGVSKQTLYNRFASKTEIGRALAARRSDDITAPLRIDGDPVSVLTAYAGVMLEKVCNAAKGESLRGVALMSPSVPDIAQAIYDAGPAASMQRLADWLKVQDAKGLLVVPDPALAAEMFTGMVLGHGHLRAVLGVPHPTESFEVRAAEAARRFVRAFAP
jgi:TetR/AcrR family transcriptional repressor of mexJK operon